MRKTSPPRRHGIGPKKARAARVLFITGESVRSIASLLHLTPAEVLAAIRKGLRGR